MANTIDSKLQLTEILDFALEEFERSVMPLTAFSTVFENVELKGEDTVTVPYYPIEDSDSLTRTAGQDYRDKVAATTTSAKQITINKNKIQGLSFTSEERRRQPYLNPEIHGRNKGRKLAYDIVKDVFSLVTRANFSGATISPIAVADFDVDSVKELAQKCVEAEWPGDRRSLFLNPSLHFNLVGQPAIMDFSQSGSVQALYQSNLPTLMGFMTHPPMNGLHQNNGTATSCTVNDSTDVITATAHGLANGDIIQLGGTAVPAGTTAATDYYVRDASTNTFKISATSGGSAVNMTDAGTSVTFTKYESIGGFAAHESAILVAFAPVPPTDGVRQKLIDYQIVKSERSGCVLEYRHIADENTSTEYQLIEANYGYALGETAALKRIELDR